MRVIISIVSLSVGIPCLLGCSAEHVSAVEDSQALLSEGEPIPGDPWGVCNLDWECSGSPNKGCRGWTEPSSCPTVEENGYCDVELFLLECVRSCTTSADCPVPLSGDVVPTCSDDGQCHLACETGTCPNGNICVASIEFSDTGKPGLFPPHMCMQPVGPEYFNWPEE